MTLIFRNLLLVLMLSIAILTEEVFAHHVLGSPTYSLNEDSNAPPRMQLETQIGDYFITQEENT